MDSITDEPYRGAILDPRPFETPGLQALRRYVHGELPAPPMSRLVGMRPTEARLGSATFSMPVTRWLEEGSGSYWGGVYALFADAPLAASIWTTLPAGKAVTTSRLSLSFVRPMSRETRNVVGRAETVHAGSQVGLSTILITDQDGRMLAFGSTRCLVVDAPVGADDRTRRQADEQETPDPFRRLPPREGYFSAEDLTTGVPIELQRRTLESGPICPVWRLTGYRPTSVEDGRMVAVLPASPWFSNGGPAIYGGILAWAAEFTMGAAAYSTLTVGDAFATLDMHIRFTRPAFVDGSDLSLDASVTHRGRRLRVVSCNVDNAAGKRVAMATSSALVVPGGIRELAAGRTPDDILQEVGGESRGGG